MIKTFIVALIVALSVTLGYAVGVVRVVYSCADAGKYTVDGVKLICVIKDEGDMDVYNK